MFPSIKVIRNNYNTSSEWALALLEYAHVAIVPGGALYTPG